MSPNSSNPLGLDLSACREFSRPSPKPKLCQSFASHHRDGVEGLNWYTGQDKTVNTYVIEIAMRLFRNLNLNLNKPINGGFTERARPLP